MQLLLKSGFKRIYLLNCIHIVYSKKKVHVCRPVMCYQYITVVLFLQLYASVKLKMEEMQQHMSWIEVQFLKKAVDVLCLCRQTLMFTYVFAFYLKKNNQSIIFEVNHVHWVYQCLVSHGNRFNLSLPFYVVVVL